MRLVKKLENRFNIALEELESETDAVADNSEVEALSKQVSDLETAQAEKDAKVAALKAAEIEKDASIATLTSQATELKNKNEAAAIRITSLKEAAATAQEESSKNQAVLAAAQAAQVAAVNEASGLKDKLKEVKADTSASADDLSKIEDLEDEIEELKEQVSTANANASKHYEKMRNLRGAHRVVRKNLKGNVLNAEEVNTAMEAELEALQMQREIDLNEVNVVLEKLTPLVEGK